MAKELRWGLLSTAHINRAVIPPLQKSTRNMLTTVASRDLAKAKSFAAQWKIEKAVGSYEDLLADPDIDVIYNPLPNSIHTEWTIKALEAGKHVLCEKPLATTVEDADAIGEAARRTGKVVAEAFMYRHHPQTIKVKELIDSGEIGKIVMMRGVFTFYLTNPQDVRMDASLGGGSIWDVGCYPISYARFLFGAEPTRVSGYQVASEGGIDLTFTGEMQFPNNGVAHIESSFRSPGYARFEVFGEKGQIFINEPFKPGNTQKFILAQNGSEKEIEVTTSGLYDGEVEDMADAIMNHKAQRISLTDSRNNVRTIISLLESARKGMPVKL